MTQERLVVIAPHPDDETLAAGGLMQRTLASGGSVTVVLVTDGENNPWAQRLAERRWRIGPADCDRFGRARLDEMLSALRVIGLGDRDVRLLHLPDQELTGLLVKGARGPVAALASVIREARPTLLVIPSLADLHPDHSATAMMVREAIESIGQSIDPFRTVSYVVHGPPPEQTGLNCMTVELSATERERKSRAVRCHATQVAVHPLSYRRVAGQDEVFLLASDDEPVGKGHPVAHARLDDSALRLEVVSHPHLRAFGPRLLRVRGIGPLSASLEIDLSRRQGHPPIIDSGSGRVIGYARSVGHWRRSVVEIPRSVLPEGHRLFVKVERRFGFFDEAGWAEVPVSVEVTPDLRRAPGPALAASGVCCVVPCYNVVSYCGDVVRAAARQGSRVIAVDDGSTDGTAAVLHLAAQDDERVTVLSLPTNLGKGEALMAAFRHASERTPFDVLITLDGDGQHRVCDIPALAAACRGGADLVIGDRFTANDHHKTPLRSRAGNDLSGAFLRWLYPGSPRDTQCGMRALSRPFLQEILPLTRGRRYDLEFDILLHALDRGKRIETVPIPAIYIGKNSTSHFRPVADSLRIVWRCIQHLASARTDAGHSARKRKST